MLPPTEIHPRAALTAIILPIRVKFERFSLQKMHSFVPLFSLYGASSLSNFPGLEVCFGCVLTAYLLIVYIPIVYNFGRLGLE